MAAARQTPDSLSATPDEAATAALIAARLGAAGQTAATRLVSADGEPVVVPAPLAEGLRILAGGLAAGATMTVLAHDSDLTTQQAADILGVSRPHLVKLLDRGDIPHHMAGTHRRVSPTDLMAYRERRDAERASALAEVARLSEELDGGYR